jgi:hypothetical protein
MILRFALADDTNIVTNTQPGGFLAVYDFPLLWRAQSYIDETLNADGTPSGNVDWNNANPWNDPVNNAWFVSQANGADVDGGQIRIKPWTSIYTYFNLNFPGVALQVHDAVPYSFGCDNTPQYFNARMIDQNNAIKQYYKPANNTTITPNPAPDWNNRVWQNWNDTLAPEGEWGNYIHANPDTTTTTYNITVQNEVLAYPYAPGFSSYRKVNNVAYPTPAPDSGATPIPGTQWYTTDYVQAHTQYSAGVECQGLVARAGGYEGNNYRMSSPTEEQGLDWTHTTGTGLIGLETPANWLNIAWQITATGDSQASFVVPGDIIIVNEHMGIVYKIEYTGNTRISNMNQIYILEAYGYSMTVYNQRNWSAFYNYATQYYANPFCHILRLKVE